MTAVCRHAWSLRGGSNPSCGASRHAIIGGVGVAATGAIGATIALFLVYAGGEGATVYGVFGHGKLAARRKDRNAE